MTTKKPVSKKKPAAKRRKLTDKEVNMICLNRAIKDLDKTECLILIEVGEDGLMRLRHWGVWSTSIGALEMARDVLKPRAAKTFREFDPIKGDR